MEALLCILWGGVAVVLAILPQGGGKRIGTNPNTKGMWVREHDGCEQGLISRSQLALLLMSQESFQKVLAFSFEVVRPGRAFE